MDVTAVIPNYNGMKYMHSCLKSLYEGSVIPRVIVVDNASSDGSFEYIRDNYPQAMLIRLKENYGFCKAVNEGIKAADTEFVILLNNDTTVDKYFVEKLVKAIRSRQEAFSVGAKMLSMHEPEIIDDAGDLYCALGWAFALGKGKKKDIYSKRKEIFAACAGAAVYRRSVLKELGYFDENHFAYLEDIDICYRAKINGYRNYLEPEAVVYHAGSAVSGSRHNTFKVRLSSRNSIYLIYKNMPFPQILLNLIFLLPGFVVKLLFFSFKGLGKDYIKGIAAGFRLSFSAEGRQNRIAFNKENLKNYGRIQLELWFNMLRKFVDK